MISAGNLIVLHIASGFVEDLRKAAALCDGDTWIGGTVQNQKRRFHAGD